MHCFSPSVAWIFLHLSIAGLFHEASPKPASTFFRSSLPGKPSAPTKASRFRIPPTPRPTDADYTPAMYGAHFWRVYDRVVSAGGSRKAALTAARKHVRSLGIPAGDVYPPAGSPHDDPAGETGNEIDRRVNSGGDADYDAADGDSDGDEDDGLPSRDVAVLHNFQAMIENSRNSPHSRPT